MLYALDKNNRKVKPKKGGKAICPYCFGKVNAACGDINIHHWRHDNIINCDPWHENETDWHREWKENFTESWREIILTKNGEKHIADIETNSGLILELQHSSISSETIRIRENFYNQMVWLIDASNFSDNFSIRSQVKSKLRNLETNHNYHLNNANNIEDNLKGYYDELERIAKLKEDKKLELERTKNQIDKCTEFQDNIDRTNQELVDSKYFLGIFYDFNSEQIQNIRELNSKIEKNDNKIIYANKKINLINSFPQVKLDNYQSFKEISFDKVSSKSFYKCKVIKRESLHSFFPEVLNINSELEFARYLYNKNKYILIINLSEDLQFISGNITNLESERKSLLNQKSSNFGVLKEEVNCWLSQKLKIEEQGFARLEDEISDKSFTLTRINKEIETERKKLIEESDIFIKELKSEKEEKRTRIMKSFKGHYSYNWKYRRKTWDYSDKPLFLDFGTHIFEIKSEDILQKLSIDEFIKKIKNWR